jgi:hypothetical protein
VNFSLSRPYIEEQKRHTKRDADEITLLVH